MSTKKEIKLLRSAIIGLVGRDQEGSYRTKFVSEMFSDLKRTPSKRFTSPQDFLDDVNKTR